MVRDPPCLAISFNDYKGLGEFKGCKSGSAAPKKAAARKARVPAKLSAKRKTVLRGRPTKLSAPVAARIVKAVSLA